LLGAKLNKRGYFARSNACQLHTNTNILFIVVKNRDEQALSRCLIRIETMLGWGSSQIWTSYDFEKLSEQIHEVTSVRLSVTTLKRIWGKLKYESAPTVTTLNVLARFAGYPDWRSFTHDLDSVPVGTGQPEPLPETVPLLMNVKSRFSYYWFLLLIPFVIIGYTITLSFKKTTSPKVESNQFSFRASKAIGEGVPNSVVFHYNARAAKTDSVFIAQTWDISRKTIVSKHKQDHSAIYYYPGFFKAKLIVDNQVVKNQDLWITTKGWLCLVEDASVPLYLEKGECVKNGIVEVNEAILKKYNLTLNPKAPRVRFFNQRNLGDLLNDNFTFETWVKNDFQKGTNYCQPVEVLIQCKDDVIIIPLTAKACTGDLSLIFCNESLSSKNSDLSKFGADLSQWTKLRVETINKRATIYVNNQAAYSLAFSSQATAIVGVQYRFNGTGAVKGTWIERNGKKIYF
jgi:hypothetical protein